MLENDVILNYLGIDYADEMITANIERIKGTALRILEGAVGNGVDTTDDRAREAMLIICEDLYTNRGVTETVSGNTRRLLNDIFMQLRLETGGAE